MAEPLASNQIIRVQIAADALTPFSVVAITFGCKPNNAGAIPAGEIRPYGVMVTYLAYTEKLPVQFRVRSEPEVQVQFLS